MKVSIGNAGNCNSGWLGVRGFEAFGFGVSGLGYKICSLELRVFTL